MHQITWGHYLTRILSVSSDVSLLNTREMLLRTQGYEVTSSITFEEALNHCTNGILFDLLILGHSMPRHQKEALANAFRAHNHTTIIALHRSGDAPMACADYEIEPDPSEVLALVSKIFNRAAAAL